MLSRQESGAAKSCTVVFGEGPRSWRLALLKRPGAAGPVIKTGQWLYCLKWQGRNFNGFAV